ncbi:MAG: hypothetical protein K2P58_08605 [Hyphomonadaceae bacterium]|nr:hypothetical protein [Hyphomonadaceae bacterium]
MRRLIGMAIAWCLCIAPGFAQDGSEAAAAELRERAVQMIASAGAEAYFDPAEHPPAVAVRHRASGMRCLFAAGGGGEITIIASESIGIPRGDDVACGENTRMGAITLYATRRVPERNMHEALADAVAALAYIHPNIRPVRPHEVDSVELANTPTPPESSTAAFMIATDRGELYTRVSIYVANGWEYKLRFTGLNGRSNIMADLIWITMLNDLPAPQLNPQGR